MHTSPETTSSLSPVPRRPEDFEDAIVVVESYYIQSQIPRPALYHGRSSPNHRHLLSYLFIYLSTPCQNLIQPKFLEPVNPLMRLL